MAAPVRVDFNNIKDDGTILACVVEDTDAALLPRDPVELYDGEGNTMRGSVRDLQVRGQRVWAVIDVEAGSWKDGETR